MQAYPICTGPCVYGSHPFYVLHIQKIQIDRVKREIENRRMVTLTPAIMREELRGLERRIAYARQRDLIRAATDLVQEMEEMGYGKTSDRALPGSWDTMVAALAEVKK